MTKHYNNQKPDLKPHELKPTTVLPAPGILESYEEIATGSAKQIVDMAEKEQKHRHRYQEQYLARLSRHEYLNQIFELIIKMFLCVVLLALISKYDSIFVLIAVLLSIALIGFARKNRLKYFFNHHSKVPKYKKYKHYKSHNNKKPN